MKTKMYRLRTHRAVLFCGVLVFFLSLVFSKTLMAKSQISSLVLSANTAPVTINVPEDFSTIQAAIDATSNGNVIQVSDGTYYESLSITSNHNGITLKSINGPDNCIIDANGSRYNEKRVITFKSVNTFILDGFTIQGGYIFESDYTGGGGILCSNSSPTITNNIIRNNYNWHSGGGIKILSDSSPTITNNLITENDAGDGAGIDCANSSPIINHNTISSSRGGSTYGGGICLWNSSASITNNTISNNSAGPGVNWGAGICMFNSSPNINNNLITENTTWHIAGGIYMYNSSPVIINNTISRNSSPDRWGTGISIWGNSSPTIKNNIISNNNGSSGIGVVDASTLPYTGTVTITYSDIYGNDQCEVGKWENLTMTILDISTMEGCISADPLFVYPDDGDYHLQPSSPCIDAGDPASDYSNELEPNGNRINMGAYGNTSEATTTSANSGTVIVPTASTGSATNITSNSATLYGTVNANGGTTTAWFNYGATSGIYSGTTTAQSLSGTGSTSVSATINGLSSGTTYYYRLAAQNSAGTAYGSEMSFSTSAPTPSPTPSPTSTATPTPSPTPTGTKAMVYGYIKNNYGTSAPIASAKIKLLGGNSGTMKKATSDSTGYFEIKKVDAGDYSIWVRKTGYKIYKGKLSVDTGTDLSVDIMMAKARGRAVSYMKIIQAK